MTEAVTYAVLFALGCFSLALLLNIWRLLTAPTQGDKILALDTMTVNGIALIVLYSVLAGSALNFEAAMLFALTGFVGTVALCKYLLRGSIIE